MPRSGTFRPDVSAVGLSITARCPLSCAHCIVAAGRHRTEEMPLDAAKACLDSCAADDRLGVRCVIVTGGEPFFSPRLLAGVLEHARSLDLFTVVVTNAYWAANRETALATLKRFPAIDLLTVSTDAFHRAFVSGEKVRSALAAAAALSIPSTVAVCADTPEDYAQTVSELRGMVTPDRIRVAGTMPAGRGADRERPACEVNGREMSDPCTAADVPIVFPDGRVIACMGIVDLPPGHPLLLGNARGAPLAALLERAADNVFLQAMRVLGPGALAALGVAEGLPAALAIPRFGTCSLCYGMAADSELLDRVLALLETDRLRDVLAAASAPGSGEQRAGSPAA